MERHDDRLDVMEEDHNDPSPTADGTSEASNSERDLISGICDDVVLAEIVPRLSRATPLDKRPVLSLLSRSWANAMAGHSPLLYDRKYNPSAILSYREFIVCHRDFSNTDATRLCVWDPFRGMKTTLPPPPIFDTIFLCDGESVYVLSPATVTEKQNVPIDVYNVWMLDLREFNLRWKKLPSLPRLGEKYNIYASICVGERYIWQRRRTLSSEADGWKLSGSGSGENDSKWLWQHIDVNTPPPQNLNFDQSNRLPLYIEMTRPIGPHRFPYKVLYARYPVPGLILAYGVRSSYIFMLSGVDKDNSRPVIYGGDLYCFEVYSEHENGGLCILKAELDNVNTRTVEEGEWVDFVEDWHTDIDYMEWHMDIWENFRKNHNGPEWPNHEQGFSSAIQVFTPNAWKIQHKIKLENSMKFFHEFIVAQNGPIYGYKLVAEKFI